MSGCLFWSQTSSDDKCVGGLARRCLDRVSRDDGVTGFFVFPVVRRPHTSSSLVSARFISQSTVFFSHNKSAPTKFISLETNSRFDLDRFWMDWFPLKTGLVFEQASDRFWMEIEPSFWILEILNRTSNHVHNFGPKPNVGPSHFLGPSRPSLGPSSPLLA